MSWDPEVLSRVRHLHLRARTLTESLMMGEHRSRRVGQATLFADYQEYVPGMDMRHFDWKVLAKSDRRVVKRFETETDLPCTVVLDLSGDLATGETGRGGYPDLDHSKAGYAITLAATLLYFMHRHSEPVGLEVIAGEPTAGAPPYRSLPCKSGRNHLQLIFMVLASAKPGGQAGLAKSLLRVGGQTPRRSFTAIITDGMEEPSTWLPGLAAFAKRGTDVRLLHLFDRGEFRLSFNRPAMFYSPEGGDDLAIDPAGARTAFAEVVEEYVREVYSGTVRWGGLYVPTATDAPMENIIRRAIHAAPTPLEAVWA